MDFDPGIVRHRPIRGTPEAGTYWIGTAISVGSSLLGGAMGSSASKRAGRQQAEAAEAANQLAEARYQEGRADLAPWREAGGSALNRLQYLLGVGGMPAGVDAESRAAFEARYDQPQGRGWTAQERGNIDRAYQEYLDSVRPSEAELAADPEYGSLLRGFTEEDFRADPGYQFRLSEGQKAIDRAAAARGGWSNPATAKRLGEFSQGVADQTYNDAFNRFQMEQNNRFNRLNTLSGAGLNAAGLGAELGARYSAAQMGALQDAGRARAEGTLNSANALIGGLTGAASGYVDQRNLSQLTDALGGGQNRLNFTQWSPAAYGPVTPFMQPPGGGISFGGMR